MIHDEQNRDDYMDDDDLEAEREYIVRREIERRIANEKLSHKDTRGRNEDLYGSD